MAAPSLGSVISSHSLPLVFALLLFVIAACSGSSSGNANNAPHLIVTHTAKKSMLASLAATLDYDAAHNCLRLRYNSPSRYVVPIWPVDARPIIVDDKRGVELPSIGRILQRDYKAGRRFHGTL